MLLIEPTIEYDEQIQAFRKEFLESGDSSSGALDGAKRFIK